MNKNLIRVLMGALALVVLSWAIRSRMEWDAPQAVGVAEQTFPSPTVKWKLKLAPSSHGSPAIGEDGTIYAGTSKGLVAVSPEGGIKWVFDDNSEQAYFTEVGSGEVVWESKPRAANFGTPMVARDGNVYVVSNNGTLYCIQPNGALRWKNSTNGYTAGPPVAVDDYGFVYMTTIGAMTGRHVVNGDEVWRAQSSINGVPVLASDNMIVVGGYGGVAVMHPGGFTFSEFRPANVVCSEAILGSDGTIYTTCSDGKFYALTNSGQVKRQTNIPGNYTVSAAVIGADGTIYLNSFDTVHALTPEFKEKWKFQHHGTTKYPPLLGDNGNIYIAGGTNSNITALSADGNVKWVFKVNAVTSNSPTMGEDGTLYSLQQDGSLVALVSGSGGLMKSAWPKYRKDSRNSGMQ